MVDVATLDYKPKPIDGDFLSKTSEYPVTGTHEGHSVRAEGVQRNDANGNPYPTSFGVHGTNVAVDWETCIADGQCTDVCPVNVFAWFLRGDGQGGSGNDVKIEKGSEQGTTIERIRSTRCAKQIAYSAWLAKRSARQLP